MKIAKLTPQDPFHMASVEIVIPFEEPSGIPKLLEGIFSTVRTNRYSITLADSGGNAGFVKEMASVRGVRCVVGGVFEALDSPTDASLVLVLSSEVVLDNIRWLPALGEMLNAKKSGGVKMVSAFAAENGFFPWNCVLFNRELYAKVGRANPEEFAFRMGRLGFSQEYCGDSRVSLSKR